MRFFPWPKTSNDHDNNHLDLTSDDANSSSSTFGLRNSHMPPQVTMDVVMTIPEDRTRPSGSFMDSAMNTDARMNDLPHFRRQQQHDALEKPRSKNTRLTNKKARFQRKINDLGKENTDLKSALSAAQRELQGLSAHCENSHSNNEILQMQQETYALRSQLEASYKHQNLLHENTLEAWNTCETVRNELADSKYRNAKLSERLAGMKEHINTVKTNREDAETLVTSLKQSQQELQACRDDLFRMQPSAQVPDSEIVKDFETVCQRVVSWLDEEIDAWVQSHPETAPNDLFSVGQDGSAATLLSRHPGAGEYLAQYMIHRFLLKNFWDPNAYLLGVSGNMQQLLKHIQRAMKNSQPPKDTSVINSWRSEAIKALASTENYKELRDIQLRSLTKIAFQELSVTFPDLFRHPGRELLFSKRVMIPAATLATKIKSSTSTYVFSVVADPFCKYKPLKMGDFKDFIGLDIMTRKTLNSDSQIVADRENGIGQIIVAMEPGLYRSNHFSNEITLRQPSYLVKLDRSIPKQAKDSH